MAKQNCWEFKNCGRESGGNKVAEMGVCPAATELSINGIHSGKNAGRACWAVTGTLCGNKIQGTFASKLSNCLGCDFYKIVSNEEGKGIVTAKEIIRRLKS